MIEYKKINKSCEEVYLEGKKVGIILRCAGGFQYRPKGANPERFGEVFPTIELVKRSLEDDDNSSTPKSDEGESENLFKSKLKKVLDSKTEEAKQLFYQSNFARKHNFKIEADLLYDKFTMLNNIIGEIQHEMDL